MAATRLNFLAFLPFVGLALFGSLDCPYSLPTASLPVAEKSGDSSIQMKAYFNQLASKPSTPVTYGTGDFTMVTFGSAQALIDCGGQTSDRDAVIERFQTIMGEDKTLEYLFVSHGDSDHIANLSSENTLIDFLVDNSYTVLNYIDFDFCDLEGKCTVSTFASDTNYLEGLKGAKYSEYRQKRQKLIDSQNGKMNYRQVTDIVKWSDFDEDGNYTGEDKNILKMTDSGSGSSAKIHVLYNYFYDHFIPGYNEGGSIDSVKSPAINNLSVCLLFEHGDNRVLLTGDLEEYNSSASYRRIYGETYLVRYNPVLHRRDSDNKFVPNVTAFKAGHHGSPTSNSEFLLDAIRPKYVYVSVVFGTNEFSTTGDSNQFLCQDVLNSLYKYTDNIFPMGRQDYDADADGLSPNGQRPFYGNVVVSMDGKKSSVNSDSPTFCESDGKTPKPFSSTDVFDPDLEYSNEKVTSKLKRDLQSYVYYFAARDPSGELQNVDTKAMLFKLGNTELLINCGTKIGESQNDPTLFLSLRDNVRDFVTDGTLEYCIVSNHIYENFTGVSGVRKPKNSANEPKEGMEGLVDVLNIGRFVSNHDKTIMPLGSGDSFYYQLASAKEIIGSDKCYTSLNISALGDTHFSFEAKTVLPDRPQNTREEGNNSLILELTVNDRHYLHCGQVKRADGENDLFAKLKNDKTGIKKNSIDYIDIPGSGNRESLDESFFQYISKPNSYFLSSLSIPSRIENFPNANFASYLYPYSTSIYVASTADSFESAEKQNHFTLGDGDTVSYFVRTTHSSSAANRTSREDLIAPIYALSNATSRSSASPAKRRKASFAR